MPSTPVEFIRDEDALSAALLRLSRQTLLSKTDSPNRFLSEGKWFVRPCDNLVSENEFPVCHGPRPHAPESISPLSGHA